MPQKTKTSLRSAGWFKPATGTVYDTLRASSYLASYIDSSGAFRADKPGVRSAFTTITLYINPEVVSSENYDVTLQGYCKRLSPTQPGLRDSTGFSLKVNYNSAPGSTYKQRDAITVNNSVYSCTWLATINVNGTTITDTADNRFRVEISTTADVVYPVPQLFHWENGFLHYTLLEKMSLPVTSNGVGHRFRGQNIRAGVFACR